MKKTISIFSCTLFLTIALSTIVIANINPTSDGVGSPLNPEEFTMTIPEVTAHPGDQVTMSVTGSWEEEIMGFNVWLRFNCDPKDINVTEINFEGCVNEYPDDSSFEISEFPEEGKIRVNGLVFFGDLVPAGSGTLFNMVIEINETASLQIIPVVWIGSPFTFYLTPTGQKFPELTDGTLEIINPNNPPETPDAPEGPSEGEPDIEYIFTGNTTDFDGDDIAYNFSWDDGTYSGWTEFVPSGTEGNASYTWGEEGTYDVRVKAKDINEEESGWSPVHTITIEEESLPDLNIKSIEGGIGITVTVENNGEGDATDVEWHIIVTGGFLDMVNADVNNTEDELKAGKNMTVETGSLGFLHLGPLEITVTADADNADDEVSKDYTAFIIGPFVLGIKEA